MQSRGTTKAEELKRHTTSATARAASEFEACVRIAVGILTGSFASRCEDVDGQDEFCGIFKGI
jgi:hypothetical protein